MLVDSCSLELICALVYSYEFHVYSWANIYHFLPFLFLLRLKFLSLLAKKGRAEGKRQRQEGPGWKQLQLLLNSLGSKFRGGWRCRWIHTGAEVALGPLVTSPGLRDSRRNPCLRGQSSRWACGTKADCRIGLCSSEKRVSDTLRFFVCKMVGGRTISHSSTGIHQSIHEDDDLFFIIMKGIMAGLHLLTVAAASPSRLWIWPYLLLTAVGIYMSLYHHSYWKDIWMCMFVNELLSTNWSPGGPRVVKNRTW